MNPRRWDQIRAAFDEIVELGEVARASRLAAISTTDPQLREAVDVLLRADADADAWLAPVESPLGVAPTPTEMNAHSASPDLQGRLTRALGGAYRIERELGGGGMSHVYVAEETAFRRNVVVKVLRPELAEALSARRFQREIQVAARLQHPHIVPLLSAGQSDGLLYYTMPFVEGESLRDRLRREGELPIDDTIRILRDVASALAYAHRHGVVHRDIKPENVLLSDGGAVVADFGIAKALSAAQARGDDATTTTTITQRGMALGTPIYMAPEQATGDIAADHRADIYALGVVGYEMLTGRPPFEARSAQQLMAAHATEQPDPVVKRRPNTPPRLAAVVMHCLEKRPADRPQDAQQVLLALNNQSIAAAGTSQATAGAYTTDASSTRPRAHRLLWVLAGLAALSAALAGVVLAPWPRSHGNATPSWFDLALPDSAAPRPAFGASIALSPDGSVIAYIGSSTQSLFVRPLDELSPRRLAGTEGALCPSFSPDGRWIVFFARGRLRKIAARGGAPIVIADSAGACGVWTDRNEILYELRGQLFRVSADGGPVSVVARSDSSKRIGVMIPTQALPGGTAALICITEAATWGDWGLGVVSLPGGQITKLRPKGCPIRYANGYAVFQRQNREIVAAPFSIRTFRFTGPEVTLLQRDERVVDTFNGLSTVENGSLVYLSRPQQSLSLLAVSPDGETRTLGGNTERSRSEASTAGPLDTAYYSWPRLSPDGRRVALEIRTGHRTVDVWVYDIASRTLTRLTNNFTGGRPSGWTPDGRSVVFIAAESASVDGLHRLATHRVASQPWDGSAPPRDLMRLPVPVHDISIGPPHGYAAISVYADPGDIWIMPLDTPKAARPFVATRASEGAPRLSGDGKLMAYESDETGRLEVYIRPVPGPASRLQVSAGGGTQPVWSADGRQLYYRGPEYLLRATIARGSELSVTRRDTLFRDVFARHNMTNYDVFPGGKELLMIRINSSPVRAVILLNWPELLRQRAATR
jgi:serine/threonine protein kinase/Tol biopolymer transport system component